MLRSFALALIAALLAAFSAAAQSPDPASSQAASQSQDSTAPADAQKPKKVWTNDDVKAAGPVSVVGNPKSKPKTSAPKTVNDSYVASVRKQLEKLQKQIADIDKQLTDLKNFSEGDPSNNASGIKLNKSYDREPIEVQMRALQDQKKDLQAQVDALLDEARKKGVEPGQLR
jgi:chaperonin cofactor prefoldin